MRTHRLSLVVVLPVLAVLALSSATLADESPGVRTSRSSARHLPLPKEEGVFHFLIFGDRTGGRPEGLPILSKAVEDANLLDPDLVMTVGDLVNGYCEEEEWLRQTREFREIMDGLSMPWFPVAGNHDIYFRGKNRPPEEHEARYEKHFGPVWYWFEHKRSGFLVLYTDEGDGKGSVRNYKDADQLRMSPAQLAWLKTSLAEMSDLQHVFVFLHHPRWMAQYAGGNWEEVHQVLAEPGNVRAVFAGHIHRMRYDGVRDGIEYHALAATGASLSVEIPHAGYLHHVNLVTVRDDAMRVSTLPVGSVLDPRQFTPARWAEMDALRRLRPRVESPTIHFDESGKASGILTAVLSNPGAHPLDVTITLEHDASWLFSPEHQHFVVDPEATRRFDLAYLRKISFDGDVRLPRLVVEAEYLAVDARVVLPVTRTDLAVAPAPVSEAYFQGAAGRSVSFRAAGAALRVDPSSFDVPDGPFTVEAWLSLDALRGSQGVIARTEMSEWGLFVAEGAPRFMVFLDDAYVTAESSSAELEVGRWHHVAGVFDGAELRAYVDGRLVARAPGKGSRKRNTLPVFVGNDPNGNGQPANSPLHGLVDEVRVSTVARYEGESFSPDRRHQPDAATALLMHLDRELGGFVFDHVTRRGVGRLLRGAKLEDAKLEEESTPASAK